MSGAASEATRARPLSGGLWSLISWLRRDDSGASSDSLSSVGSDRTVASFAFLSPDRYRHPAAPIFLPPPGPPTDSYKKRVRDRNTRLQHDRDLTLHRKYGLFRGENGYDGFSLPPARKFSSENIDREERERRATSEFLQRRTAHVPGKRRAPPPPARSATLGAPRRSRKRPAPQPPRRPLSECSGNATIPEEPLLTQISVKLDRDAPPLRRPEAMECKPDKYVKKEIKESKSRPEKSFLKQIFESRKRNSTVETIPERILPSISELDKQAAEIIESCKLKALDRSDEKTAGTSRELRTPSRGDMWFCTRCLRKYNDSVVTCGHCVTEQKMKLNKIPSDGDRRIANRASNHYTQTEGKNVPSTTGNEAEEKQKLKEMLKEIKDSLPKRPKHDVEAKDSKQVNNDIAIIEKPAVVEAPTLRIGSKIYEEGNKIAIQKADNETVNIAVKTNHNDAKIVANTTSTTATETAVVTQPIVLQHLPSRDFVKLEHFKITDIKQRKAVIDDERKESNIPISKNKSNSEKPITSNSALNTPLKISSLLNSDPLPEKESRTTFFLQPGNHYQQKTNNQPSSSEAKPSISPNLLIDRNIDSTVQQRNSTASTTATKVVLKTTLTSQEQATQKPLKATSTTQTSNNINDLNNVDNATKSKQNVTNIKDVPNNQALNNRSSNLERDLKKSNTSSNSSVAFSLTGAHTSNVSSPPNPHANTSSIVQKVKVEENQQKSSSLNTSGVMFDKTPKLDIPRAVDHYQQSPAVTKIMPFDQHLRRRDLINQLEQSIAKGDERAAADAAAKLAQLRLSCSVLSFSSQIVGASSTSSSGPAEKTNEPISNTQMADIVTKTSKLEPQTTTDKLQNTSSKDVAASSSKVLIEKKPLPIQSKLKEIEKKNNSNNKHQSLMEPSTSKQKVATGTDIVSIDVWIEDKEAARGPIRMNMPRVSVMGDLRRQANAAFGLAAHLQRWIVGRTLCSDDNTPLHSLAGPGFDAPFYLCLVEPETNKNTASRLETSSSAKNKPENNNQNVNRTNEENKTTDVYAELVLLERRALVPNAEDFECGVCMEHYKAGQGAVLRECIHTFCRDCLSDVVKHSEEPAVSCPAMGCPGFLQEREIRALVSPEDYERWLARGLAAAESGTRNAFHCRTRDCQGWALCEPGVTRFPCPVCKRTNCVSCQAIHEGDTCEQYRANQRASEAANRAPEEIDEGTRAFLDTLISRGEALECPECNAIITKKWGCDWIKCSACKTEICWVTRGRRWGPGGRGDTSAGCRCGVDGQRCHPSCGYCH